MAIHITGDSGRPVLTDAPFALLVGMLLDQQYPMEHAFRGPAKLLDRFGTLEPAAIAAADPEEFARCAPSRRPCTASPARWRADPGAGADRASESTAASRGCGPRRPTATDLLKRLQALPGFGQQKAQIFVALLAKQLDVRPPAGRRSSGDYSQEGYRSVADVVDAASLQKVRAYKKEKKAAAQGARAGLVA